MAGGLPQRKEKTALTLIPEEERAISYRFNIALVGEKAHDFAMNACESEMAQAYKPKKATKVDKMDAIGEDEEEKAGPTNSGTDNKRAPSPACQDEKKKHDESNDALVLFCPIGGDPKSRDVARLRFQPIENFSDSIPQGNQGEVGVALLHWEVSDAEKTTSVINDFNSRMAEIIHLPASKRPYTAVLAFELKEDQQTALDNFVTKQSERVMVNKHFFEDDQEDTVFDALQAIVDGMIEYAKNPPKSEATKPPPSAEPKSSRACAIL